MVSYEDAGDEIDLKTIIPSRKATCMYWGGTDKKTILDSQEKKLLESFERGEWKPTKRRAAEMAKLQQYARHTLQKNKRINIQLSERLVGHTSQRDCPTKP